METLIHLKQTTTVIVYKAQFEALTTRLQGLIDYDKLSYFLSVLKDKIRLPTRMFSPLNLNSTFGLCGIKRTTIASSKKALKPVTEITNFNNIEGGSSS